VRPARRDVCGTDGGVRTGQADLQRPDPPLHAGAAQLDPADDRQSPAADRHRRPAPRSFGAAAGLRLRSALPERVRSVPRDGVGRAVVREGAA
jgi:hypothetical protein